MRDVTQDSISEMPLPLGRDVPRSLLGSYKKGNAIYAKVDVLYVRFDALYNRFDAFL